MDQKHQVDIDIDIIPILNIYGLDYRCIINGICKNETINFHCHAAPFNYDDLYDWRGIMVEYLKKLIILKIIINTLSVTQKIIVMILPHSI